MEEKFKPLSFWRELLLKPEELQKYYIKKREYQYNNGEHLKGTKIRKALHPILLTLMSFARKHINKQTLEVIKDERIENNDKPVIFAITHIGMYDVQIISEAIKDHHYILAGDPETMYRNTDGLLMSLNGVIYCDNDDKGGDTIVAKKTAIDAVNKGLNLFIAPEGVWNLSPNLLALPLFNGVFDIALETGCEIVPVAIEQFDNEFVVNIGKNINVNPNNKEFTNKEERKKHIEEQKEILRDSMATLKWEIMEKRPVEQRKMFGKYEDEYKRFVETRYNEWVNKKTKVPYYNDEIVERRTFKPKNIVVAKEAFAHLEKIKINKDNVFLLGKCSGVPEEIEDKIKK